MCTLVFLKYMHALLQLFVGYLQVLVCDLFVMVRMFGAALVFCINIEEETKQLDMYKGLLFP